MVKELIPRPLPAKARLHLALEENANLRTRIAALEAQLAARTGGVKVKPLEWKDIHQRRSDEDPTTEVVGYEAGIPGLWWRINVEASDFSLASPEYSYQTFGTLEAAQAAAQADYERRILSALEPAAPEGQQEPVAWGEFYGGKIVAVSLHKGYHYTVPLYTRPSEQAVTEAEIQRLTTEIARKHGCDRGTFTVCWGKVEKGLPCRCEDEARHALTALGAQTPPEGVVTEAQGWRPIETAPKDGTPVLLARFDRPSGDDDDLGPDGATVGHWAHFPGGYGGWYLSGLGVVGDHGGDYHPGNGAFSNNGWPELDPTHWMPLPTPPALAQEGK